MQIRKLPRYAVALLLALTGYAFGTNYQPTSSAITLQFSGDVDANSYKITNLATATVSGDAASKGYVDGVIVGGGVTIVTSAPATGNGSTGTPLTVQTFGTSQSGVVPSSGGGTANFIRADGTWAAPPAPSGALTAWYGDGTDASPAAFDGSTTILGMAPSSNVYTMTRSLNFVNITINSGVTLKTAGWVVNASGTATINGKIAWNGNSVSGQTGGAALGGNLLGGGSAGSTGGFGGSGTAGLSQTSVYPNFTVAVVAPGSTPGTLQGGAGGTCTSSIGGNGGALTSIVASHGQVQQWSATAGRTVDATQFNAASGGGGGGGGASSTAGGGGSGGGTVVVNLRIIAGTGTIEAKGGNGGNASGGSCGSGGGGGGGGVLYATFNTNSGSVTATAAGGAVGTNVGTPNPLPSAGGNGVRVIYNMSGDGTTLGAGP